MKCGQKPMRIYAPARQERKIKSYEKLKINSNEVAPKKPNTLRTWPVDALGRSD
jgi:hypothetical protein